jgi:hypothetical protein
LPQITQDLVWRQKSSHLALSFLSETQLCYASRRS